jgi:FixJ family two-component response regulator
VVSHLTKLTPRQRQVLDGVLEGEPSKIIAAELGLSAKTVDAHRARIMEKLGARSLPDLFRLVVLARSQDVPHQVGDKAEGERAGRRNRPQ